jgi:uncharacterized membrane protein
MSASSGDRLGYLDWLRGLTVLVMIQAHGLDAWLRPEEKARDVYGSLVILGGMAAPAFLFMAGIAVALAAAAQMRRGRTAVEAARRVERRGWQIFAYAFVFRLQSFVLGGFSNAVGLLKVDILNIMGPAIVATAAAWRLDGPRWRRALVLAAAAIVIAVTTPAVRNWDAIAGLPDPLEWYFHPDPGKGTFTVFPWAGFVLAGAVVGIALDGGRHWPPWRLQALLAAGGVILGVLAYTASWQPALFPNAGFWTTSPAFFTLRTAVLASLVPLAWLWSVRPWPRVLRRDPLEIFGVGSLFVYWVHVELVYGGAARSLRGALTLEQGLIGWILLSLFMFVLLLGWNRTAVRRAGLRERALKALNSST